MIASCHGNVFASACTMTNFFLIGQTCWGRLFLGYLSTSGIPFKNFFCRLLSYSGHQAKDGEGGGPAEEAGCDLGT